MTTIQDIIDRVDQVIERVKYYGESPTLKFLEEVSKDLELVTENPDWLECPECSVKDDEISDLQTERDVLEDERDELKNQLKEIDELKTRVKTLEDKIALKL